MPGHQLKKKINLNTDINYMVKRVLISVTRSLFHTHDSTAEENGASLQPTSIELSQALPLPHPLGPQDNCLIERKKIRKQSH